MLVLVNILGFQLVLLHASLRCFSCCLFKRAHKLFLCLNGHTSCSLWLNTEPLAVFMGIAQNVRVESCCLRSDVPVVGPNIRQLPPP